MHFNSLPWNCFYKHIVPRRVLRLVTKGYRWNSELLYGMNEYKKRWIILLMVVIYIYVFSVNEAKPKFYSEI